jgi:phosphoketolase
MIILDTPKGWTGPKVVDGLLMKIFVRIRSTFGGQRAPDHLSLSSSG